MVGSQTLTAGGAVTVSGTEVSLAAGGGDVVVGTSTEVLAPYISAGFGTGPKGTTTPPLGFTGGAGGRRSGLGLGLGWREIGLVGLVGVWL